MRPLLGLLIFGLISGCAALRPKPLDPGLFLLSPASARADLSVTQALVFSKGEKRFESVAALEVSPESVSLVGLGPMGNRMLALRWDGKKLEKEADPSLPKDLPLELILRDVMLAYWPAEAVRGAVANDGWTLEESPLKRTLQKGGKDLIRIRYDSERRWHANVIFEHVSLGYRLDISAVNDDE